MHNYFQIQLQICSATQLDIYCLLFIDLLLKFLFIYRFLFIYILLVTRVYMGSSNSRITLQKYLSLLQLLDRT